MHQHHSNAELLPTLAHQAMKQAADDQTDHNKQQNHNTATSPSLVLGDVFQRHMQLPHSSYKLHVVPGSAHPQHHSNAEIVPTLAHQAVWQAAVAQAVQNIHQNPSALCHATAYNYLQGSS